MIPLSEEKRNYLNKLRGNSLKGDCSASMELQNLSKGELNILLNSLQAYQAEIEVRLDKLQKTHRQLEGVSKEYQDLYEYSPVGYASLAADGQILKANKTFVELFDPEYEKVIGKSLRDFLTRHEKQFFSTRFSPFFKRPEGKTLELRLAGNSDRIISVSGRKVMDRSHPDHFAYLQTVVTDVSLSYKKQKLLNVAEKVFNKTSEGIIVTDRNGKIIRVNSGFLKLSGYSRQELIGQTPAVFKSGQHDDSFYDEMWQTIAKRGVWRGEIWNRKKNGNLFAQLLCINRVLDSHGDIESYVGICTDITEKMISEKHVLQLAHFDTLTNLPNRALFYDRLEQALRRAKRDSYSLAILFLDLDYFKEINDAYGHDTGDKLLQQVARRLKSLVRASDTVARLDGDEFVFLLDGIKEQQNVADQAIVIAQKVLGYLQDPFDIDEYVIRIGGSVGISLYPNDGEDVANLLKHADLAMYQAKRAGRGTYHFFSDHHYEPYLEKNKLKAELDASLDSMEFVLHYQPKVALADQKIVGFEALIRWQHPERGLVYPDEFFSVAEETGLSRKIGDWVLNEACQQLSRWFAQGRTDLSIGVNFSAQQLKDPELINKICKYIDLYKLPPQALEIEITETAMFADTSHLAIVLKNIADLGICVSLDDFGVGYSSLNHIKHFPINILKIDKSFVRSVLSSLSDQAIIQACISLAKDMGIKTVAEGIEMPEQVQFLKGAGCDYIQGYLVAQPLVGHQAEQLIFGPQGYNLCG